MKTLTHGQLAEIVTRERTVMIERVLEEIETEVSKAHRGEIAKAEKPVVETVSMADFERYETAVARWALDLARAAFDAGALLTAASKGEGQRE